MQDIINSLSTYGYIILFLYSLGGGFFALMAAGILSYAGKMDISLSISVAFVANFIGDLVLFYLGRYNKEIIMPYLKNHKRKLALSHLLMKRHGYKIIFIQKFIYGLKTLVPIAIGLTKYDMKKFTVLNLAAAALFSLTIGLLSYYAGAFLIKIVSYMGEKQWIAPAFLILIVTLIWFYFSKASKKREEEKDV